MNTLVNTVRLIGNLGRDPEVKTVGEGGAYKRLSVTLATSIPRKNKNGEYSMVTDWHNVHAWGKLAETMGKYLLKGQKIAVNGRLTYHEYDDGDGTKRKYPYIEAYEFMFLGSPKSEDGEGAKKSVKLKTSAK